MRWVRQVRCVQHMRQLAGERGVACVRRLSVDRFTVQCPYCGEYVEIAVEPDVRGTFVQDCEVCCNPWRVRVVGRGEERDIDVSRADGSE